MAAAAAKAAAGRDRPTVTGREAGYHVLLDVGLDASAAVAAITEVLEVGLFTDAAAILTADLMWNLTLRVLLDVEPDAPSSAGRGAGCSRYRGRDV
ncbi:hypothetical protein PF008_g10870 [Phytophthora fragariae]|uniref:Uncharacterized protein n=1 Tax=Phytophthora fragariae TaxID=53985 RepID=A0A6G0RT03_9STRA|nr:hypothetical protein PF008_g10870 [Phytophthora fragariae]